MLSIKVFYIDDIKFSDKVSIEDKALTIKPLSDYIALLKKDTRLSKFIKNVNISIINPAEKNISINSIMDFVPISTKVLGNIGSGITHTLTGVVCMITGADEAKTQICEFGSSDGILEEQVKFSRAGTPKDTDYIIHIDFEVYEKAHFQRECINACHEFSDIFLQDIRNILKKKEGKTANERHDYEDYVPSKDKKRVVILKQVAGQGAMYDTRVFASEPSGFIGGYSIIDFMNMPIMLTPNEYRDGAVRAMH